MGERKPRVAIIGSGVSGLSAILQAVESGADVTLISRTIPARSSSACVREGINSGFGGDFASHVSDTLESGCGLADKAMVERMCADAPRIAELLGSMGLLFDRTQGEGRVRIGRTCGSSHARTIYSGRATGARVLSVLTGQVLRHESYGRVRQYLGWEFLSLMLDEGGRCRGVVAQDLRNMRMRAFAADAVILCTGGFQALFASHCSSELCDGFAAVRACEQGAKFSNPEFVEIFPFTVPTSDKCRAVVDASLVEGNTVYVERDGRPWYFLREFYPEEFGCVVRSKAMRALLKARGELETPDARIKLDITHFDPAVVEARIAPMADICDGVCEPGHYVTEVVPSVGLTLGGLWVDADHAASMEGLFAAGNCSAAYHGAGSLAGNELLASIHGGMIAGASATRFAESHVEDAPASLLEKAVDSEEDLVARISAVDGKERAREIDGELSRTMTENATAEKDNEALARAAGKITELSERALKAPLADRVEWANGELFFSRILRGKLALARLVVDASLAREESRGCHIRSAFPNQDDAKWNKATTATIGEGGAKLGRSDKAGSSDEEQES
jgi:succinate dehydrogenase / fumarate reductase flavoprotein subunit